MPAKRASAPSATSQSASSSATPNGDDPIRHVIVLMLENRSFDQMLGAMQSVYPDLDGAASNGRPRSNPDVDGHPIEQTPTAVARMKGDPQHELPHALHQLENNNGNFVIDYARSYPHSDKAERQQIMAYFPIDSLPALHTLARNFTVCDRWFSSLPGATWPNRLFVHSGTSIGHAKMPHGLFDLSRQHYDQDTIYDRLNERNLSWKIYFGDFPQSMLLQHQWQPQNARRYRPMEEFFSDAAGPHYKFPAYSFIEPRYYAPHQNDDHPPHDVTGAQQLVADVYNAIRKNRELWESTLLVIVYDEHGGFYDHVSPPAAVPPDEHRDEYSFDRLGVRVPAILVSPWVNRGVEHTVFDHTSILKYSIEKWGLAPLGNRAGNANNIATALKVSGQPRQDTPESITVPAPAAQSLMEEAREATELNDLQMAMAALAMFLELQSPGDPKKILDRLKSLMQNPAEQTRFAKSAIQRFVETAENPPKQRVSAPRRILDKGHPGKGAQGRAHRKKLTIPKLHHEKQEPTGRKGKTKIRPT